MDFGEQYDQGMVKEDDPLDSNELTYSRQGAFVVSYAVSTADGEEPTADPYQVSILLTLPSGSQTVRTYSCDVEEPPEPIDCDDPQYSPPPPACET